METCYSKKHYTNANYFSIETYAQTIYKNTVSNRLHMLVKVKIVGGEEKSLNILENATIAELKEELSNAVSRPTSQIKLLKPNGGVLLGSTRVKDVYTPLTPMKAILTTEISTHSGKVSVKIRFLNRVHENFELTLASDTTVNVLKDRIAGFHGLEKSSLTFLCNGLVLSKSEQNLKQLNIRNGSTIIVKQSIKSKDITIRISVMKDEPFTLSVPPTSLLFYVRQQICSKIQKPIETIKLLKSGVSLTDDNKSLKDYNIQHGQIIHVVISTPVPEPSSINTDESTDKETLSDPKFQTPFFTELSQLLSKHFSTEEERLKVMQHFDRHTLAYVRSLNLEDIEDIASSTRPKSNN